MPDDCIHDLEYADVAVLLSHCRYDAEFALESFCPVASSFRLTVSIPNTKLFATGHGIEVTDTANITVNWLCP